MDFTSWSFALYTREKPRFKLVTGSAARISRQLAVELIPLPVDYLQNSVNLKPIDPPGQVTILES